MHFQNVQLLTIIVTKDVNKGQLFCYFTSRWTHQLQRDDFDLNTGMVSIATEIVKHPNSFAPVELLKCTRGTKLQTFIFIRLSMM